MISLFCASVLIFVFCVIWTNVIQRTLFGIYNRKSNTEEFGIKDTFTTYCYGLKSDVIIASYITIIPWLLVPLTVFAPHVAGSIMTVFNIIIAILLGLAVCADIALYPFWKYKLDASVLSYLRSPKSAFASVSNKYILIGVASWVILSASYFIGSQLIMRYSYRNVSESIINLTIVDYLIGAILWLLEGGILFMIIRGIGIRPNNPSISYFSQNSFLNHWAVNPIYNLIYSFSTKDEFKDKFRYFPQLDNDRYIKSHFPVESVDTIKLLKTNRPNILLIVCESFSTEFTLTFGGERSIASNIDRWAKKSIVFTNCTCGSFRTDRALVNILSGYPAQPTTSIIRYTRKLPMLPGIARSLREHGYSTMAIHGGPMSTMHKNDYYLASGHTRLVEQKDFQGKIKKGKWGIHDEYAAERAFTEMQKFHGENKRFFITLQTLSSHEPFEVPYDRFSDKIDNSFAYTDECIGKLLDQLKKSELWDNLLVILVADHSLNRTDRPFIPEEYSHIPLMMTGGAVKNPMSIDTIMSQTDIAATVLGQLDIQHDNFEFSRDIFSAAYSQPIAFHVFNNGVLVKDNDGVTVYDTLSGKSSDDDPKRTTFAKMLLQKVYYDLASK